MRVFKAISIVFLVVAFGHVHAQVPLEAGFFVASGYTYNRKVDIMFTRDLFVINSLPIELGGFLQTNFSTRLNGSIELAYSYVKYTDYYTDLEDYQDQLGAYDTYRQVDVPVNFIKIPVKANYQLIRNLSITGGIGTQFLLTNKMERKTEFYSILGMGTQIKNFGFTICIEAPFKSNAFVKTEDMLEWHIIENPLYWFSRKYLKCTLSYKLWSN